MNHVGKNIRILRKQKGWTQSDVASQLDISVPAFSKIETGVTDLNISRLYQIASLFGVKPVDLLVDGGAEGSTLYAETLDLMKAQLAAKDLEIIRLQSKVIWLYETVRSNRAD